jgi:acetyl esterase/lipase
VDRGALPAQAVLLVGAERDAYLVGEPADDARFVAGFSHALEHAGGYARKLSEACVRTTCTRYIGTIHDFVMLNALADTPAARGAVGQAIAALRSALA